MFTFINKFSVSGDTEEFERVIGGMTDYMIRQPGFLRSRFYRSTWDPAVYVEIAEWESADDHKKAASSTAFQERIPELMKLASAEPGGYEIIGGHD